MLNINNDDLNNGPTISAFNKRFKNFKIPFLIDTGSEINLIKISFLKGLNDIDKTDILQLTGIGNGSYETLGSLKLNIFDRLTKFHVVHETFPIKYSGILGAEFLRENSASLTFNKNNLTLKLPAFKTETSTTFILPARTKKLISLIACNNNLSQGYLPRINAGQGIYIGEGLVNYDNGTVRVLAINTTLQDVELSVPPVTIEEVEVYNIEESPESKHNEIIDKRTEQLLKIINFSGLSEEEKNSLLKPISDFSHLFFLKGDVLGATNLVKHKIVTTDDIPTFQKQYRHPETLNKEVLEQARELLNHDIIEESDSPSNSPVWIVPKKPGPDGERRWRMVIDFRKLNDKTIKDSYPLPNINYILDQLGGAQYFSILDLAMGFHQIPMDPESKNKTAFSTPFGHYHFNRMPFGLKNAPSTFQRLVDKALLGLQNVELFVYMDDVVIYADSLEDHTRKLLNLFDRLDKANLTLQPEKCIFLRKEVNYLGHVITQEGVKPDPKKVEAVRKFPCPRNAKNVKQFLGLAGYYRRFIPQFSIISKPLTFLLKNDVKFQWTEAQDESFNKLKNILCTEPLLQYPDFSKEFILSTDASHYGIGGVLSQDFDGKVLPIAYASRTLNDAEINYSTIEKEFLAMLFSVENFRPYLFGRTFKIETDHKPLIWLHNMKNPNSRIFRWRARLSEYQPIIVYKKGTENTNADALSRNPCDMLGEEMLTNNNLVLMNDEVDPLEFQSHPMHEVTSPPMLSNSLSKIPLIWGVHVERVS